MKLRISKIWALGLVFLCLCLGQVETSTSIRGLISDPTGAAAQVPG